MPASAIHRFSRLFGAAGIALAASTTALMAQDEVRPVFPLNLVPLDRAAAAELPPPDDTRILGGDIALDGAWPWQVALIFAGEPPSEGQFCGGTIIAERWILTAAHCVVDEAEDHSLNIATPDMVEVLVGTNNLARNDGEVIEVIGIYTHADYDPLRFDNDIALIQLAASPTDPDVAAIRLPSLEAEARYGGVGIPAIVTGWGRMLDGRYPNELRQAQIDVLDRTECNAAEAGPPKPGVNITGPITENMICSGARMAGDGQGSCYGDSGGPLVVQLADQSFIQIGIVSWGYDANNASGCDTAAPFEAYTRVARYQTWIVETIAAAN